MSDAVADPEEMPAKSGKKPMILALVLALLGGGGGFYAASTGLIPFGKTAGEPSHTGGDSQADGHGADASDSHGDMNTPGGQIAAELHEDSPMVHGETVFVEVDPITISLNESQAARHLRFRAQLEVNADYKKEVSALLPRVTDVMNSYLRALELKDLTGPMALVRLRAQLLRRMQVVTGKGRVKDLLIMEFVLN